MHKLLSDRMIAKENQPDVYEYDCFPKKFRNQLFYIISDVCNAYLSDRRMVWDTFHDRFAREIGEKKLGGYGKNGINYSEYNIEEFVSNSSVYDLLDFIDFIFHLMEEELRKIQPRYGTRDINKIIDRAIEELNERFKQNHLGYEFTNKQIVRIDNKLLHQEVIKPALRLLYEEEFEGAEEEFRKAFDFKRKKDNKNAILEAEKSFESTIKTICEKNKYPYDKKDTAKQLIKTLESNHFYPEYMNAYFAHLTSAMTAGLPVVRNKEAGHGQGSAVREIPDELAEYAINLAASNIVLLIGIYKKQKKGK